MDPASYPKTLLSVLSAAIGALMAWWALSDRMEKQITERVNLTARVAQLGERVNNANEQISVLRSEVNALRLALSTNQTKPPTTSP